MSGLQNRDLRHGLNPKRSRLGADLLIAAVCITAAAFTAKWVDEAAPAPLTAQQQQEAEDLRRYDEALLDCARMAVQDGGQWPATDTCVELIEDDAGEDAEEYAAQMSWRS